MNRTTGLVFCRGALVPALILLAACSAHKESADVPLAKKVNQTTVTVKGVPGGVTTRTARITATVTAIDYEKRSVTLQDGKGGHKTLTVGPDVINFNQIEKGDRVKFVYVEEMIVHLQALTPPVAYEVAGVVARAPEGSKPQGMLSATKEVTAVVAAVDLEGHTATLQFPEGLLQVFPVRPDVELRQDQVGSQVVIVITSGMAVSVDKIASTSE